MFVLEWSKSQNAFHIQEVKYSLEGNCNKFLDNDKSDYIPLVIGTRIKCDNFASNFRNRLVDREINNH